MSGSGRNVGSCFHSFEQRLGRLGRRRRGVATPGGFTLLELLLAAGLTTFVVATLLTAIGFVARTESSSAERVELARLGAALLDQMRRDVGGLVNVAEVSDETETRFVDSDEAIDAVAVEDLSTFLGAADRLDLLTESDQASATLLAEMVEWTAAGAEWDGGFGPRRRLVTWGLTPSDVDDVVITRSSSILSPDGYESLLVGRTAIAEVVELSFRYLSEGEWLDVWDSVELGGVPPAIEVTLGLQSLDAEGEPAGEPLMFQRVLTVPSGRYPAPVTSEETLE